MGNQLYPSDLTDAQWALTESLIPVGRRRRKTSMRDVLNAILYLLRTGCQWRYLPRGFPPRSTVWSYFDQWRRNGTLQAIRNALREQGRLRRKPRQAAPAAKAGEAAQVAEAQPSLYLFECRDSA